MFTNNNKLHCNRPWKKNKEHVSEYCVINNNKNGYENWASFFNTLQFAFKYWYA